MAAKCKKCDPHEICEECPEWIFTLADLIMCMMGLFVLLWVLKPAPNPPALGTAGEPNKDQAKQTEVIAAVRAAFGYVPNPNSSDPIDVYLIKQQEVMRLVGKGEKGTVKDYQEAVEGTDPLVQTIRPGNTSIVGTRVLFRPGESVLGSDDTKILADIADQIRGQRLVFLIKGHASRDDFGENGTPQQLMDVSLRRAQAAADYLVRLGVSPDTLRVQGCSTFEPVRQKAYTADAQQQNRRVEISSTGMLVSELQDPKNTTEKPLD